MALQQLQSEGILSQPLCPARSWPAPQTAQHTCLRTASRLLLRRHTDRHRPLRARRRDPIVAPFIPLGDREGEQEGVDLYGYLLRNRIITIGSRINDEVATQIVASLLALETLSDSEDIKLYINSAGGQAYAITAILDTIAAIKPDVSTVAYGQCVSTATLLLAAGAKGKRYCMPSARIMMHQPQGGAMGSADEVNIQASELNRTMKVISLFYSQFTGLPLERVEEETDRDNFMSPERALELGLIDAILPPSGSGPTGAPAQGLPLTAVAA